MLTSFTVKKILITIILILLVVITSLSSALFIQYTDNKTILLRLSALESQSRSCASREVSCQPAINALLAQIDSLTKNNEPATNDVEEHYTYNFSKNDIDKITSILAEIKNNRQAYKTEADGSSSYINWADLGNSIYNFRAEVRPYKPRGSYTIDYEGMSSVINFDDIINSFDNLNAENQKEKFIGSVQVIEATSSPKFINNTKYAVYDDYFKPSGTLFKNYLTVDKVNKKIIIFSLGIYASYGSDTDNRFKSLVENDGEIKYPNSALSLISRFEKILNDNY